MIKKLTIQDIISMKKNGERISMLTAYDASFAGLIDAAGIDMVLVGDSLGMVLLGYNSTIPVTMEEMLHHCRAAGRGVKRAVLVGDMPFMSYQVSQNEAISNAGRFLKEAGCDAVKLEGGTEICDTVKAIVKAGIPLMGHIGLTPQTASQLGGYRVQGRDADSARRLLQSARDLEAADVFAIVLECIPAQLSEAITRMVSIPTIGIGAGKHCDGQVLVTHDMVGMFEKFNPSFVKQFAKLAPQIKDAVADYNKEVKNGSFPAEEHSFNMQLDVQSLLED
ncbi:MAG: 3-methyl-2-oxobutanoate hydroxymethyltransferase [Desulfobulbaceae bacterium]|jgi:3-methyl-2-oxobutanoate hydroxymethyltransferase|nr:3-methyl-2-oxobutanoate hydroxymethyltransferase [Desulfobulbaceae bacterium]HKJ13829.1 3-methyl-2-oxobutanoate hydroxymethyltransferase [Desulfobulbales bacterium]MDH3775716.1 3-methyl-2-oxobutanoate hydroxymethyltransferase [Desulfobulbaceae bacterium]MDH3781274.1 3-methyl-2-oxobutanoate hydroxymethyltransferase [Desulfobulbaceae bacterium]MDH3866410.1 3-methyl-2-oxobutanoate hydroxymethyltransferase [Desulfobulbaceae bacterium]